MHWRRVRRNMWRGLACSVLGLALVLISLPLWFPLAFRPLARKMGATYSTYHREGYARFTLSNVVYSNGSALVHAENLQAFTPTVWLARLALGRDQQPFARA